MNDKQLPSTQVLFGKEVKEAIRIGIDILEQAVGSTLGAKGQAVGIDRMYENVIIRDGVNVAKAIILKDRAQNFALSVMREAAQKTVQDCGDATTATIILAHALYVEAEKRIATGISPRSIEAEIMPDITEAIKLLQSSAIPVTTLKQKIEVARISCEEESLGELIGGTIDSIGEDGVVTVDFSKTGETYVDMQEGMQWDRGLASPYFITNPDTLTGTIEDGYVFVTDFPINNIITLKPLLDDFINHSRFLTIIAPEFGGDGLTSLIANKAQNVFLTLAIKAPGIGRQQTDMLGDIAALTGATFITADQGHKLEDVRFEHLGKAAKVSATQTNTILAGGEGERETIDARIATVKKLLEGETNEFELERLKERLAKLTNGVAVIKVGGQTDIEIKERYERALDATLATRQAVKGGIINGGETAYLNLISAVKSDITKKALQAPFRRLVTNAGYDSGQLLEKLLHAQNPYCGVDVIDGEIKDMMEAGIIDPVNCLIASLTNAASVAIQLLNTATLVLPQRDEKENNYK